VTTSGESAILAALAALAEGLTESGAPAMIIGGIAVIARGVPRQTVDVDATVWGDATSIEALVEVFRRQHIVPRITDAVAFAKERQVLLLRHSDTGTPIEVTLASLPFEREAIGRGSRPEHGTGPPGNGPIVAGPEAEEGTAGHEPLQQGLRARRAGDKPLK
jgi:hypothetical protein